MATSSNNSGNDLVWYANDGSGNFTSNVIGNNINFTNYLQVADIDGDNDQDILVTQFNARDLTWYENNGSETFTASTIESNLDGIAEVKVADVDGDGDLDAVVTGRNADDVVFYTNSDSGYVLDISLRELQMERRLSPLALQAILSLTLQEMLPRPHRAIVPLL